jgi:hypothetical protein
MGTPPQQRTTAKKFRGALLHPGIGPERMLGSGCGVQLVAGMLGQQHHAGGVHVGRQGPQQSEQLGRGEDRDVVDVDLVPEDLGVVDA